MKIKFTKWEIKPSNVIAVAIIYLILAWGFSYFIDVHNFLGFRDKLFSEGMDVQLLWYYLFHDGFITEWLQWIFLGGTALVSSHIGGRLVSLGNREPATFWILLSAAAVLMFIEDAFNARHYIAFFTQVIFDAEGFTNPVKTITHLIYFVFLASIPMYALLRFWRYIWASASTSYYIAIGFITYGMAAFASGTRDIMNWYSVVGESINGIIASGIMSNYFVQTEPTRPLGFYLMDSVVEESIELIAAAALLAAAFAYLQDLNSSPGIKDSYYKGKIFR